MQYYLAPMEGITTYIFRRTYHHYFGEIDKYFTPFIASRKINARERNEILPEHNTGFHLVPQILTNRADEFLQIAQTIASFGYRTVNLNLGCPSGTVTARRRGAGFLGIPKELDAFLSEIYEKTPVRISIKTRIGVESDEEWKHLLEIFGKYPIEELIIHPRLQQEQYKGTPHKSAYQHARDKLHIPLCYNGDIDSVQAYTDLLHEIENIPSIMIGRGIIKNPALVCQLKQSSDNRRCKILWQEFHNELLENYATVMSGATPVLYKMKDLWTYLSQSFTNPDKYLKKIRKSANFAEYKSAVNSLFQEQELLN